MNDGKIILVVEDEKIVALDIQRGLKKMGYNVPKTVSTGADAIQTALDLKPHLIVMDIHLADEVDGVTAAKKIRETMDVPIIFLTANADEATLNRAKFTGAYGYLLKPFEENELYTAIEMTLEKHQRFQQEKLKSSRSLLLSEKRFELFMESVDDHAVIIIDTEGIIINWNTGAQKLSGHSIEDILGQHFEIFLDSSEQQLENPGNILAKSLQGGYSSESWRLRKDGTKFYGKMVIKPIYTEEKELIGHGLLIQDLTKEQQIQETLTNAIKERDDFLSIVSHELKTPIALLLMKTEMSQLFQSDKKWDDKDIVDFCNFTMKQVQRMDRLVSDMLDIARIKTKRIRYELENFNFTQVAMDVVEQFQMKFEEISNLKASIEVKNNELPVTADKVRIEQIISNLLSNALAYGNKKPVNIIIEPIDNYATISVIDHGRGIPHKYHHSIFNCYERAIDPSDISGMGLGLYISSEFAREHKGKLELISSEINEGSHFQLKIPLRSVR